MTSTSMQDGRVVLHNADCRDVLRGMPDNSIDSVVTDPPYALVSIQKRFANSPRSETTENQANPYGRTGRGFMGQKWDNGETAFSEEFWAEVLRVLKPGGHVVAFSGTRTYHRMAVAIEDAGFEIRDQLGWLYGSGFPKSHDVSKGIDRVGGMPPAEQAALLRARREQAGLTRDDVSTKVGCTQASVRDWEEGRARVAGGPVEHITPSKAYRAALADILGYSADERRLVGVATDRRDDGTVYGVGHTGNLTTGGHTDNAAQWEGWGTALKPAWEPICLARKPLMGTVAENVLEHGTGAINVDGCRVGDEGGTAKGSAPTGDGNGIYGAGLHGACEIVYLGKGRWPANVIHDGSDEVVAAFPDTGKSSGGGKKNGDKFGGGYAPTGDDTIGFGDSGSAARFFYCAKASRADRDAGLESTDGKRANIHPTVKPVSLCQWLCRLVTPPGGVILDPFMGSGSTGKGAVLEGFQFVGIEREEEYIPIAISRIAWAVGSISTPDEPKKPEAKLPANDNSVSDLFSDGQAAIGKVAA